MAGGDTLERNGMDSVRHLRAEFIADLEAICEKVTQ